MILVAYLISICQLIQKFIGKVYMDMTISLCPYKVGRLKTGQSCEEYNVSVESKYCVNHNLNSV